MDRARDFPRLLSGRWLQGCPTILGVLGGRQGDTGLSRAELHPRLGGPAKGWDFRCQ